MNRTTRWHGPALAVLTASLWMTHAVALEPDYQQSADALLAGTTMAISYSGYREGQHPDRGSGAANPSTAEVLQDLHILVEAGFDLIRLYDARDNSAEVLRLIRERELPIRVLLGAFLDAEVSNHEGCAWLDEPIPEETLIANIGRNDREVEKAIALALEYPEIVIAVNVGNEALVEWNDHMMTLERVIELVRRVKAAIPQPVTVADSYDWWIKDGAPLVEEVDFIGAHTYPIWEGQTIDNAIAYSHQSIAKLQAAYPGHPIAVLEAGWATTSTEFGDQAGEAQQARYFRELAAWAANTHTTVFYFSAFDEPWKGDPDNPLGAEKHWGLYRVDRSPKRVMLEVEPEAISRPSARTRTRTTAN